MTSLVATIIAAAVRALPDAELVQLVGGRILEELQAQVAPAAPPRRARRARAVVQRDVKPQKVTRPRAPKDVEDPQVQTIYKIVLGADEAVGIAFIEKKAGGMLRSAIGRALRALIAEGRVFKGGNKGRRVRYGVTQEAADEAAA